MAEARHPQPPAAFPQHLRTWRRKRRLSQLALALAAGVSQRHLSCLESGRASPSRGMIIRLGEALEVSLRERNTWLTAAGFAPVYAARPLDDPAMAQVQAAVRAMLDNHLPLPAVAVDRAWTIRMSNAAFDALGALLGDDLWQRLGDGPPNLMRLFFHPEGLRPRVTNWTDTAPLLWQRAEQEAAAIGGEDMAAVLEDLRPLQDAATLAGTGDAALVPVLPLELDHGGLRLSLFSVISTFGTAQDVTADELRIESFFPADEATRALFAATAST